jgi:hypothetical protein
MIDRYAEYTSVMIDRWFKLKGSLRITVTMALFRCMALATQSIMGFHNYSMMI